MPKTRKVRCHRAETARIRGFCLSAVFRPQAATESPTAAKAHGRPWASASLSVSFARFDLRFRGVMVGHDVTACDISRRRHHAFRSWCRDAARSQNHDAIHDLGAGRSRWPCIDVSDLRGHSSMLSWCLTAAVLSARKGKRLRDTTRHALTHARTRHGARPRENARTYIYIYIYIY